ncbi:glycosyltransferase [Ruminococcus sp.]
MELKKLCDEQLQITVVATFYNCAPYIHRCVDSILKQTYPIAQIILVDDGSDDGSDQIFCEIEKNDRIQLLHSGHQGVSIARNMGIETAQGDYIMFVDGDDYISPTIVEELVEHLGNADMICCTCQCFHEENKIQIRSHFYDGDRIFVTAQEKEAFYSQLMDGAYMQVGTPYTAIGVPWGKLYRRDFLNTYQIRFYPELKRMQDNIFNMEAAFYANEIRYIDEPLYCYRLNNIVQYNVKPYSPEIYSAVLLHRQQIMAFYIKTYSKELEELYNQEKLNLLWLSIKHIAMSVSFPVFRKKAAELMEREIFDCVYEKKTLLRKCGVKFRVFSLMIQLKWYRFLYWYCNR